MIASCVISNPGVVSRACAGATDGIATAAPAAIHRFQRVIGTICRRVDSLSSRFMLENSLADQQGKGSQKIGQGDGGRSAIVCIEEVRDLMVRGRELAEKDEVDVPHIANAVRECGN